MDTLTKEIVQELNKTKSKETKEIIKAFLEKPKNPYKSKGQYLIRCGKVKQTKLDNGYIKLEFSKLTYQQLYNIVRYVDFEGWNMTEDVHNYYCGIGKDYESWYSGVITYKKYGVYAI